MSNKPNLNRLLTPKEVSEILGVEPETLNVWRSTRRYLLPYVKAGRLVRYRLSDLNAFIEGRIQGIPP